MYATLLLSIVALWTSHGPMSCSALKNLNFPLRKRWNSTPQKFSHIAYHNVETNFQVNSNTQGVHTIELDVAGTTLSFETGKIGRQASGAVVARTGDTIVYSTVCFERDITPADFSPLRVDYFSRYSAAGQTINTFQRRDSKGDDNEILVGRLIDRPLRPMIMDGWQHDTQVLAWLLSYDKVHAAEPLAICAASAAMAISEVPLLQPIAGVFVGRLAKSNSTDSETSDPKVDKFIINPTEEELQNCDLRITVAGTKNGILMIEGEASFVSEETTIKAITLAHEAIKKICTAIEVFAQKVGKQKKMDTLRQLPPKLVDQIDELYGEKIRSALQLSNKNNRGNEVGAIEEMITQRFALDSYVPPTKDEIDDSVPIIAEDEVVIYPNDGRLKENCQLMEDEAMELVGLKSSNINIPHKKQAVDQDSYGYDINAVKIATKKLLVRKLREIILGTKRRSDGRDVETVRDISIESDWLPGAHGSVLFTRGETQSIATATIGTKSMEAKVETVKSMFTKRFYLQYKFPPSSVNEVGRVTGVSRREVGHGNLAERALLPAIPSAEEFPYSIRAESLITESSGSSSMATVCACSLAMLDAGVPLKSNIAGVAMGMIFGEKKEDPPIILTDILGLEDALGTMDFKVAGNAEGITTFQLDIKSEYLTTDVLEAALYQARRGRLHILKLMDEHLKVAKPLKPSIPKMLTIMVPPESLGKIIGPKGKTVDKIIEMFALKDIILEDDGTVSIESDSVEKNKQAYDHIQNIVKEHSEEMKKNGKPGKPDNEEKGPPPEEGQIYRGCEIKGIHPFGVFVEVTKGYEGLVHISEIDINRVNKIEDMKFEVGQKLDVKYIGKNDKGQMRYSRRQVLLRDIGNNEQSLLPDSRKTEQRVNEFVQDKK